MKIEKNKSLKKFNTFGIDVRACKYVELYDEEDLKKILSADEFKNDSKLILGGGSNILFTKDYEGLVIKNSIPGIKIIFEDDKSALVKAGAGVVWNDLVLFAIEKNLGGIENLISIPGTVGAAPVQNIGAYGEELMNKFHSLKGIYFETGKDAIFEREECRFDYRNSIFKKELKGQFVITYVILQLIKNPRPVFNYGTIKNELDKQNKENYSIKDVSEIIAGIRKEKLPDPAVTGNAGSFFKNPEIDKSLFLELKKEYPEIPGFTTPCDKIKIPAGWLIEKCGWKGKRIGNAGVHDKQALVLVTYGNTNGSDILSLACEIKISVIKTFGIELTEEVNIY
ncbi:MAG: UDP-N-acetylmuramate dehydrogenase [Ignavibacteriaceae bacterium]|nr:UDP-N-acetylmuramate dehydrogenase [Ignavibacteriaceae bacterium]